MDFYDLDNYGIRLVNFESVFTRAYGDIVNDLYLYDKYNDHNVRSQDTKKIYYYHLIKSTCDAVLEAKTNNRVIVYYSEKDVKCDFKQCMNKRTRKGGKSNNRPQFVLFMNRFFKQLKGVLPIKVYNSSVKFNTFIQYYNTNKGKYLEMINDIRGVKSKNTNMEKFKIFSEKYKLTYLTKHYVDNVKVKCMMYK